MSDQPTKPATVQMPAAAFALLLREIEAVHKLMDVGGVPRESTDGSRLSMSQRVHAYVSLTEQFLRDMEGQQGEEEDSDPPPHTSH